MWVKGFELPTALQVGWCFSVPNPEIPNFPVEPYLGREQVGLGGQSAKIPNSLKPAVSGDVNFAACNVGVFFVCVFLVPILERFRYGDCLVNLAEPVYVWLSTEEHEIIVKLKLNISCRVAKASYTEQLVFSDKRVNTKRHRMIPFNLQPAPMTQSSLEWTTPCAGDPVTLIFRSKCHGFLSIWQ